MIMNAKLGEEVIPQYISIHSPCICLGKTMRTTDT